MKKLMKNAKKLCVALLIFSMLPLSLLSSCQRKEESENDKTPVLKVAALSSGYEAAKEGMWKEICEAYTKKTGTKVKLTLEKNLEDVIGASMQGGEFPDVVLLATGRTAGLTEQFIKDRNLKKLDSVLEMNVLGENVKVKDKLLSGFVGNQMTAPYDLKNNYLLPMFYSPCGLFYNQTLFKEKGYKVPETFDEMWELGEKAKKDGIALFTYPTTGYLDTFFYSLLYSVGGKEFFNRATSYDPAAWNSKEGKECLEIMAKIATYTHKKTPSQANDQDFTKNQLLIMNNEALFMPNGTWIVGEMKDAESSENFKWGMAPIPSLQKGGERYSYTWIEQIWMPKAAKNEAEGKKFMSFLYSDEAASIFLERGAIQPIKGLSEKLEGEKKEFYSIYEKGVGAAMGSFAPYKSVAGLGKVSEYFFDPISSLVSGDLKKEEWFSTLYSKIEEMRKNKLN